ncbi:MAG: lytic murein transglycosylase [Alphaproteobacteria bacterium]|nr:lytic murein transglycosylase [Alphaproteobacteria bacterium]
MNSRVVLAAAALVAAVSSGTPVTAQSPDFLRWLDGVRQEAAQKGISQATIRDALSGVQPIARVLELDRRQPETTLTFQEYIDRVVNDARVARGRQMLDKHREILQAVSQRYGVQARFIVALWAIESDFGRITGNFQVVDALTTLAYDGRRSAYFRGELFNALRILDQGHIAARAMRGSWAGAMGQSQFMPSSFLSYAQDFDGDGRRDIWGTLADVFASAANYLRQNGWRGDETWGRWVLLPPGFDRRQAGLDTRRSLAEWQAVGVRRTDGEPLPGRDLRASVILPGGADGPASLVYENYRTIMKWNRSHYFAHAVGILADQIGGS